MLRTILSITGVGLIALGTFGGSPLDKLYRQLVGQPEQMASLVIEQVEITAAADTDSLVTPLAESALVPSEPVVVENVEPKITVAKVTAAKVTAASVTAAKGSVESDMAEASELSMTVAQNLSPTAAGNAVDSATARKNTSAMTVAIDQVKSSDRNDQVSMAKTVLTSTAKVPAVQVADKKSDLENSLKATVGNIAEESLTVLKDKVNMRDGPSIDHPIVLELAIGQELMEFKREGKWVHVGAYGTSGKIGWVHQRLVGPSQ